MRLSELKAGESAIIVKILGHGAYRKRLIEMGFVKGQRIRSLLTAPLRDPVKYKLMDYEVSLRRSEAELIEIVALGAASPEEGAARASTVADGDTAGAERRFAGESRTINVALIGNPNCGKTTLFNIASGAREHVGNYSGVTVDAKHGTFMHRGYRFNIVDLPGTYSLSSYSPEELYVRRYLRDETPDVIVNVVVASNLERNLYLSTELIDMDRSMVIALNMYDELQSAGTTLDYQLLGKMIGVPMVPTVSKSGKGINELFDTVIAVYEGRNDSVRHVHVNLGDDIESGVRELKDIIKSDPSADKRFSPRYMAIKFLEGDGEVESMLAGLPVYGVLSERRDRERARIERTRNEDLTSSIAGEKYGFIAGALAETMVRSGKEQAHATHIIDRVVTSKLMGIPVFLLVMFLIFWVTFEVGSYPMEWIENGVDFLADFVNRTMPDGVLKELVADGIIGGVGGVIVFLPNILILYFFISFMEDSGYMARAAFIMDKVMHKIGLHGKSFIPLVMGFGCNVPAVMATRCIESRSSRLITILINPFMSCSARLPVYVLMIGTFFERHAAFAFMGLYAIGIMVAVVTAKLLRRFRYHVDETPFVMELPPYRLPTFKTSVRHMWGKAEHYLKKMGGIILVASVAVWALNYFPHHDDADASLPLTGPVADDSAINPARDSYLEMLGKAITPVFEPLGFHWRGTVAAVAGVPAKEIVVSTLGVLYTGDSDADDRSLSTRLTAPSAVTGQPDFTPASAMAFLVFILLYCPCVATIVAIVKETGRIRYGVFSVVYNTVVAWCVAGVVYRLMLLVG